MKKIYLIAIFSFFINSCTSGLDSSSTQLKINYTLDVRDIDSDLFTVSIDVNGLKAENNIYNFPATVPGTYSMMDLGRFVTNFKAYDESGNEILVDKITKNQWRLSSPEKVKKITYHVEDTYDSTIGSDIYPMSGTGIEKDLAIINTFCVFGFFKGLQQEYLEVKLSLPEHWTIGTALPFKDQRYYAKSYDHLADSPIIAGRLTNVSTSVGGIDVNIYVYSSDNVFNAEEVKNYTDQVLKDAASFISYPAAENYSFLFTFLNNETMDRNQMRIYGALEHSYSSLYIMPENIYYKDEISDIAAHEFFHVVTPLNIHSDIIEKFNFITATPSRHLWLYEGVTEWASDILQLRSSTIELNDYLARLTEKISSDRQLYDQDYSLEKISLNSYKEDGEKQYPNVYERGAVVAALLDLRLLELSKGNKGLRELIIELSKKYGKNKAFKDEELYQIIVDHSYPEIEQFINDYIKASKSLPSERLFNLIGINYIDSSVFPALNLKLNQNENLDIIVTELPKDYKGLLKVNDVVLGLYGKELTLENAAQVLPEFIQIGVGGEYKIKVKRNSEIIETTHPIGEVTYYGLFEINPNASEEQINLRNIWMRNIDLK